MKKREPQSKPRRGARRQLPANCDDEKTETVQTAAGPVRLRVRKLRQLARVRVPDRLSRIHGDRIEVRTLYRYEVAVLTERMKREGNGFRVLRDWLVTERPTDEDLILVHLEAGEMIHRAAADRVSMDRAPARPLRVVRPQLPSAPGMEDPGDGGPARPRPPVRRSSAPTRVEARRSTKRAA